MLASISALFDDGDNPGDEGPDDPNEIAVGELMEYQSDMQAPINEPLPATPDINALPANVPPNPSLGDNAGFIQSLGIDPIDTSDPNTSSSDPFEEDVDQAVEKAQNDPNKAHHIFENPTHDHQWSVTGLSDEDNWNLIKQTLIDNQQEIADTPNGVSNDVETSFGSYTVVVRYIVINGILRISTAWITVP